MKPSELLLGYDLDFWYNYEEKLPIKTDISTKTNSHVLISGMSGGGKSFLTNQLFARFCAQSKRIYFADFKQDDTFSHLRNCDRYYPYDRTLEALDEVYAILHDRQSGADPSREPITLIWDEYIANMLSLISLDKKKAEETMRKVSEILMLGRSLTVRLVCTCQRPDAVAFPTGSRLNYGVIVVVGSAVKSIYDMLLPKECVEKIGDRQFKVGEGVVLLQGSQLRFLKVPVIQDEQWMKELCVEALNR